MTETYSLSVTGQPAESLQAVASLKVGDTVGPDGHNYLMRIGAQVLCKKPDGSQAWFTIDAERSTPNQLVMKAV